MPVTTTSTPAKEVMDRVASLMNDSDRAVYTYTVVLPFLNMAIDELHDLLQDGMSPMTNTAGYVTLTAGQFMITPQENPIGPHYPGDLLEIRALWERQAGATGTFTLMIHRDTINPRSATTSLLEWYWEDQIIKFNANGATSSREIKLEYIRDAIPHVLNENSIISVIGVTQLLAYKTASMCAKYIGENYMRSESLAKDAEECEDHLLGIDSKAKQNITTRRRPFRSSYKGKGWF